MAIDPDDTVRLRPRHVSTTARVIASPSPPRARRRPGLLPIVVIGIPFLLALGAGAWLLFERERVAVVVSPSMPAHPVPAPQTASPPPLSSPAAPPSAIAVGARGIAEIEAAVAPIFAADRLAENPRILMLTFASLAEQAAMLNRIAAFIEKAGQPRDRVLSDPELAVATGPDPRTYYIGHDYSAAALRRFFATAARDGIVLNDAEERLRALLKQEGMLAEDAAGALVSVPAPEPDLDPQARLAVLRHELSHGEYFTNPDYAAWTLRFWNEYLSEAERAAFRAFLAKLDYDMADEELMANEMQAFLVHTPDGRFFSAAAVGLSPAVLNRLRGAFIAGMPEGWLKARSQ